MEVGQKVMLNNVSAIIIEKHKGHKTNKSVMQSGCIHVGFKSSPCTYTLSTGQRVRGSMLRKI